MEKINKALTEENKGGNLRAICGVAVVTVIAGLLAACSSIDCPLNNRVLTKYQLTTPDGKVDTLKLYTTISTNRTDGSDSVLINRDVDFTKFTLPVSNSQPRDTFFVQLDNGEETVALDTLVVEKQDRMHFEAPDCAASYFHHITAVTATRHAIDSVTINNHEVDYDTSKTHFRIYFTPNR